MTIQLVSFADILSATDLLAEYAAECSIAEIGPVDPQAALYQTMETLGMVGFASLLMTILPHYGRKVATLESLFVGKDARSSGLGRELMAAVEQHARQNGCVAILYSAPAGGQLERVLMLRKGYHRTNSVFCRSL
jgi:GNAT superfamily N-acetyltransferase